MSTQQRYARALVSGRIVTQSPLHIGNDATGEFPQRIEQTRTQTAAATLRLEAPHGSGSDAPADDLENAYSAVIVDAGGKPYIPASTLRGALRAATAEAFRTRLFGPAKIRGSADGQAGIVRLSDAPLKQIAGTTAERIPYWDEQRGTGIQHGIAIDAVTGAVKKHMLYRLEFVPADSEFAFSAVLLDAGEDDLEALADALRRLDGGSIGNGVAQGYGRIGVAQTSWKALTDDAVKRWARGGSDNLAECYTALTLSVTSTADGNARNTDAFRVELIADSPILVHQPGVDRKVAHSDGGGDTQTVVMHERDASGKPRIPGTTLKGWARARARRILKTIHAGAHSLDAAASKAADALIDAQIATIFGAVGCRSRLYFSDAIADAPASADEATHDQTFIAVDRFSGGVIDGALFRVWAVPASTTFRTALRGLDTGSWEDWQRGLLLWLLRDIVEGDLAVGSGKGKGFGRLRLRATSESGEPIESWAQFLHLVRKHVGKEFPAQWAAALEKHVANLGQPTERAAP